MPVWGQRTLDTAIVGPVRHEAVKLLHILRGRTVISHEGGAMPLRQGAVVVLPPGRAYVGEPAPRVEIVTAYVDPLFAVEQLRWLPHSAGSLQPLLSPTEPHVVAVPPHHRRALHHHLLALAALGQPGAEDELYALELFLQLMAQLRSGSIIRHDKHVLHTRREVTLAIQLLERHLDVRWTVDALAAAVSLSPSQLTRLFVQQVGITPARYLREARAHRMRELIAGEGLSVTQAAHEVGWPSISVAARAYRSVFGRTPSR